MTSTTIVKTVSTRFFLAEEDSFLDQRGVRYRHILDNFWSFHIGKYLLLQKENSVIAKCLNIRAMWVRAFKSFYLYLSFKIHLFLNKEFLRRKYSQQIFLHSCLQFGWQIVCSIIFFPSVQYKEGETSLNEHIGRKDLVNR